jgi:hypothetical protein
MSDLTEGLVGVFERTCPALARTLCDARLKGAPQAALERLVNASIDREKTPHDPQRGELTRNMALTYIEWLYER